MQTKYQPNFASLTDEEAQHFAGAIYTKYDVKEMLDTITGTQLYDQLSEMDHKTACMALATDPSIIAITILEKVVGKEIVKDIPKSPALVRAQSRPATQGAPKPRLAKNDPRIIYDIVAGAKKPGSASAARYALYQEGMTVTEFLAAGGTAGDVKHDVGKGFIKLKDAE